ncbi:DgyrCDS6669 [Dimorphilus gyrociliatus]|uniref:DgyrCDS6669 n=1 Tax=Dimorphilus gyrociliatus TaxID=2664684 RepID=A0A7I8VTJ0_9ANNE|nr:DgyrCDS6669 [Dimorphilus gyrociliatus]
MNNSHLIIASIHLTDFTEKSVDENGRVTWSGLVIELLDILSEMLNFRYSIIDSVDGFWGGRENGSWTGFVKMLLENQCDLAASKITVTSERRQAVDFTSPFMYEPHVIFSSVLSPSYEFLFLKPFKTEVWLCLLSSLILMAIVFCLIRFHDPDKSIWYIFGSYFNQAKLRAKVNKLGEDAFYNTFNEGLERISSGGETNVMILEEGSRHAARRKFCNLQHGREGFMPVPFALMIRKQSPYKALLDKGIDKIVESGIIARLQRKYIKKEQCPTFKTTFMSSSVKLSNFSSILYLLYGGILLSR